MPAGKLGVATAIALLIAGNVGQYARSTFTRGANPVVAPGTSGTAAGSFSEAMAPGNAAEADAALAGAGARERALEARLAEAVAEGRQVARDLASARDEALRRRDQARADLAAERENTQEKILMTVRQELAGRW